MKKIGIITFHRAVNYGAVLQSYALQKLLFQLRLDNEIIDYKSKFIDKCYKPFFVAGHGYANALARGIFFGRIMRRKKKSFLDFNSKNLVMSKTYYTFAQLQENAKNYLFFITGSDQVFSPVSAGFDRMYFLPFAQDNQKYSYAASFGVNHIDNHLVDEYKFRLKGFSRLSVREKTACNVLDELGLDLPVSVNLDPTLLLDREDWRLLCGPRVIRDEYVLLFNVEKPINDISFAKKLAKQKGLKLVYINDRTIRKDKDIIYIEAPSINSFLTLFRDADYIVTNSFHGTAMSIIFKKEFFVELENHKARNIRVEDLLNLLGISDREIDDYSHCSDIDWDKVQQVLHSERKRSEEYIRSIVGDFTD